MDDAPTYASLTEEINSLKRLQKVHKARFDVAQKARRTKLDGPGEAVRRFTKELAEQRRRWGEAVKLYSGTPRA